MNIYLTTDAGRSWRPIGPKENDRVGFAIGLEDTGGPHSTARSYKTSDGGLTWTMTEAFGVPTGAGAVTLAFPTARDGWFAVNELTRAALFHTIDGGTNWREVGLPDLQPNEVVLHVGGPRFFGANNGLLAAAVEDRATGQDHDVVYMTTDGGAHWAASVAPATVPNTATPTGHLAPASGQPRAGTSSRVKSCT